LIMNDRHKARGHLFQYSCKYLRENFVETTKKIQHTSIFNIWTHENVGYIAAHGTTVFDGLKISLDGCYFAL